MDAAFVEKGMNKFLREEAKDAGLRERWAPRVNTGHILRAMAYLEHSNVELPLL